MRMRMRSYLTLGIVDGLSKVDGGVVGSGQALAGGQQGADLLPAQDVLLQQEKNQGDRMTMTM